MRTSVAVQFIEAAVERYADGPGDQLTQRARDAFSGVRAGFDGLRLRRTFRDEAAITLLANRAAKRRGADAAPPFWRVWFYADALDLDGPRAEQLAAALRDLRPWVTGAQVVRLAPPPGWVIPVREPSFFQTGTYTGQTYVGPSTPSLAKEFCGLTWWCGVGGVDAAYGWRFPGGNGRGVAFADVEVAWRAEHPDLAGAVGLVHGVNLDSDAEHRRHGTAVVAIVAAAAANGIACAGIAPGTRPVHLASIVEDTAALLEPGDDDALAPAIEAAVAAAAAECVEHGIVLIEAQTWGRLLVEAYPTVRTTIREATRAGAVVIEAAGTADSTAADSRDLDAFIDPETHAHVFDRSQTGFADEDSGATVVSAWVAGSGDSPPCPYGSRIDCHAWGNDICVTQDATSTNGVWAPTAPTQVFGGSSGAAAIVAGVAAQIQGMLLAAGMATLDPFEMRKLLAEPSLGTDVDLDLPPLGPMPDLSRIATALGLPDVRLRHFDGHDGGRNLDGPLGASPDIVPGTALVVEVPGGPPVERPVVRVRFVNRGAYASGVVRATVYEAPLGPFPVANWRLCGSTSVPDVAASSSATSEPVVVGGKNRTIIVATGWGGVPPPERAEMQSRSAVIWAARALGVVAWRSVARLRRFVRGPLLSRPSAWNLALPITICGPPNAASGVEPCGLVFSGSMLEGCTVWLVVDPAFAAGTLASAAATTRHADGRALVPLVGRGGSASLPELKHVVIPAAAPLVCGVIVEPTNVARGLRGALALRQLVGGREIGRVTFTVDEGAA